MKVNKETFKTNEAWREGRAHSIGASEVGILLGEYKFNTPMMLAEKKKAELNGIFNYEENEEMQDGHDLEDYVAKKFCRRTGYQIIKASAEDYILKREDLPFIHVSPDRTYWIDPEGKKNDANKGLLECKTTWMRIDKEDLPMSWQLQIQVQMGVGGFRHAHLAWLCKRTFEFDYKKIEFNPEVFDAAVELCNDFWKDCVEGDKIPDPVNADDVVRQYPQSDPSKTVQANGCQLQLIEDIKEKRDLIKRLDAEIENDKDELALCFQDEEAMVDPNTGKVVVTYKTSKPRVTVDSKALKAKYPNVFAECSKESKASRTMLIK